MIPVRRSSASRNDQITEIAAPTRNVSAIRRAVEELGATAGAVLLVGGNDLLHFRLRVAQSQSRHDHLPSFWSHVAILTGSGSELRAHEVALDPGDGFRGMPESNGVQMDLPVDRYDDPERFPNAAVLRFPVKGSDVRAAADDVRRQRGLLDLGRSLLAWLAYVWGSGTGENPLMQGIGVPSAQFVEAVHAALDLELTPGLESRASSPEAVWQAAIYWHDFYAALEIDRKGRPGGARGAARARADAVRGVFWLGQPAAAVVEHDKQPPPGPATRRARPTRGSRGRRARRARK